MDEIWKVIDWPSGSWLFTKTRKSLARTVWQYGWSTTVIFQSPALQARPLLRAVRSDELGYFLLYEAKLYLSAHRNKNNQGAERDWLLGLTGDGPKGRVGEQKAGDTDNRAHPPRHGWLLGSGDDERGTRLSTKSLLSELSAGRDMERKCHSQRACWVNLDSAESCCLCLHRKTNTITPTPPRKRTHTLLNFHYALGKMCNQPVQNLNTNSVKSVFVCQNIQPGCVWKRNQCSSCNCKWGGSPLWATLPRLQLFPQAYFPSQWEVTVNSGTRQCE